MTRAKGIATVPNLQTYLQAMDSLRARMAVIIEKMQELEIDQIPKFGDDAMKAALTNIHTGLCTCEERIGAKAGLPWEFAPPAKSTCEPEKKPSPAATAGAIAAKKSPARTKGVTAQSTLSPEEKSD